MQRLSARTTRTGALLINVVATTDREFFSDPEANYIISKISGGTYRCGHCTSAALLPSAQDAVDVMHAAKERPVRGMYKETVAYASRAPYCCPHCPSEYRVSIHMDYWERSKSFIWRATVYRWSDLGKCRRPDEREWVALTRVHGTDTLEDWDHGAGESIEARYLAARELK